MSSIEPQFQESANPEEVVRQIAGLLEKAFVPMQVEVAASGKEFRTQPLEKHERRGVQSLQGRWVDDAAVIVRLELARASEGARVSAEVFFRQLSELGEKIHLIAPEKNAAAGISSLWAELRVRGTPMSLARECAFLEELRKIDDLASALRQDVPVVMDDEALRAKYSGLSEYLRPVYPCAEEDFKDCDALGAWAGETHELMQSGACIAIETRYPVLESLALAALARKMAGQGETLGLTITTAIPCRGIIELAGKAPGTIAVPAVRISLGSNPYELNQESQALLRALGGAGTPVLFPGTYEQLQSVFHGGQGSINDPLLPIVRHVTPVPMALAARFAVREAARRLGGLPRGVEATITDDLLSSLAGKSAGMQYRLLPYAASRVVRAWSKGNPPAGTATRTFVSLVGGLNETIAGLGERPRAVRSAEVQDLYTKSFIDPALFAYFTDHLLGQDAALEQLVSRLRTEGLSRPANQPFRYCAQGTPGTGKSESAALLARRLGIPFLNIDAASLPDIHTASAQLLGSGRGIVGSHQSGRLEQAAKHHRGAVIEVSDLDHAVPSVRSSLSDLFLQLLETGEAQSAMGAMFSCANLLFAFTMNLPGGQDAAMRNRIGFSNPPSRRDIQREVATEIQRVLSGAFLSRVGTPIVFDPLEGAALEQIIERAIRATVLSSAERLGIEAGPVSIEEGLGAYVLASMESRLVTSGARALFEHGRTRAVEAFLELHRGGCDLTRRPLLVARKPTGGLTVIPNEERK